MSPQWQEPTIWYLSIARFFPSDNTSSMPEHSRGPDRVRCLPPARVKQDSLVATALPSFWQGVPVCVSTSGDALMVPLWDRGHPRPQPSAGNVPSKRGVGVPKGGERTTAVPIRSRVRPFFHRTTASRCRTRMGASTAPWRAFGKDQGLRAGGHRPLTLGQ